jgi:hypothetical protein
MQNQRWLAVILVILGLGGDGICQQAEPQATFTLKNGWVEFALRKDGRPVANATIQVINEHGKNLGDGETGENGQTAFPLPPGASFVVVEIKAGERTADPIRLYKRDSSVEPARVLLSYGLRSCCRSIKPQGEVIIVSEPTETAHEEPMPWHFAVPVIAGLSVAAAILFVVWRR